jgi:putative tricarboxylic transport membrane protein
MKLNDAVFGILLMALGGWVLNAVQRFPKIPGQQVGPALFPGIIATGLCIGGLILLVRGWQARSQQPWFALEEWARSPRHLLALATLISAIAFYILFSTSLGFLPCSVIILTVLCWVLRVKLGWSIVIAVVATGLIHFAFYKLLRVPLPWGILTPYAW